MLEIPDISKDAVWEENLTQPQLFSARTYYMLIMLSFLNPRENMKKNFNFNIDNKLNI